MKTETLARDRQDWSRWIARFSGRRVLVVGDIMLDRYIWGDVHRISPEAPVQVVAAQRESVTLGGSGNTARNIASLGGRPLLVGLRGRDAAAESLTRTLRGEAMETAGVVADPSRPTTVKLRVMGQHQQLLRVDYEATHSVSGSVERQLLALLRRQVSRAEIVVVSDYHKGVVTARVFELIAREARRRRIKILLDPKPSNSRAYRGVSLLAPNWGEARTLSGLDGTAAEDPLRVARRLRRRYGCPILITRGEKGMFLLGDHGSALAIPTKARDVFDVSGAGDTVMATLALALAAGAPLDVGAQLANYAAGVVVGRLGTSCVTPQELQAAILNDPS
ncbi:MAG: D-glycero-beta-D-manno-heptose-7-phosphate kinase [Nitrospirae bacterium]|nr:D-glycero-beta-D-manno-heptose-7-phosphate kinase [Nitrospirota bacterium]